MVCGGADADAGPARRVDPALAIRLGMSVKSLWVLPHRATTRFGPEGQWAFHREHPGRSRCACAPHALKRLWARQEGWPARRRAGPLLIGRRRWPAWARWRIWTSSTDARPLALAAPCAPSAASKNAAGPRLLGRGPRPLLPGTLAAAAAPASPPGTASGTSAARWQRGPRPCHNAVATRTRASRSRCDVAPVCEGGGPFSNDGGRRCSSASAPNGIADYFALLTSGAMPLKKRVRHGLGLWGPAPPFSGRRRPCRAGRAGRRRGAQPGGAVPLRHRRTC